AAGRLAMLDVKRVLKRGFALVSGKDGSVTSASGLSAGEEVDLVFQDGSRRAEIKDGSGS
ncbi:MAG: exodeoxyribonuclease VII large subunit, partial [Chlorobiales bacterium]|nr:exodeoxyribonuclease VII large subunit [Chlorobiales bacterium]